MTYEIDTGLDRAGYEVDEKQLKIWKVELDLAQKLIDVCNKNKIKIFVWAGTLLGAVRHKGFIPWDDDMDFAMERSEFVKLIEHADEFEQPYFLQYALNDRRYFIDYARLRNSNTTGIITWNKSVNYNNGIFLDIFVLDGVPKTKIGLDFFIAKRTFLRNVIRSYSKENIVEDNNGKYTLMGKFFHFISKFKSYDSWYRTYNRLMCSSTNSSNIISLMTHEKYQIQKYYCNKQDTTEVIYLDFEKCKLPALKNYSQILTNSYGDYMKFPPVEQRGKWHETMIVFDPDVPYTEYLKNHSEK